MWHLILLLIGFVFCSENGTDVKTHVVLVGEDVSLQCPGISKNDPILAINWKHSDGTPYFYCDQDTITCDENTTEHSIEREGDTYISILTIRNASLIHEDEYSFTMFTRTYKKHCQISLRINVPPTGLILVDKRHGQGQEVLQDNGSLKVDEGENKTIVCKTNTSVKPAVELKWMIPEELNVTNEYGEQIQDEQDERLYLSIRTLSFTPNYTFDDDISLVCKMDSNESFAPIQTLIHISKTGETTVNAEDAWRSSTENQKMARSDDVSEGTDVSKTPMTTVLTNSSSGMHKELWFIAAGGSGGVILLLVCATTGVIIRSKKMAARGIVKLESTRDGTQSRPSQDRGALPTTPTGQSSSTANHLPDRQPSPTRSFRPALPIPSDISMRLMVPVSDDTTGSTSENNRLRGATSRGASASSPATHSQRGLDTDMEYDMLNDMEYDVLNMEYAVVDKTSSRAHGAVPHVYRETTHGLAEYALVSRPKMGKNALQPRFRSTEELDTEFEYAVVDKLQRTGRDSVPHVYTQTMSGLEEYAVVNKPKDKKKRQSEVRHTTAPGDFEAEYAVVCKSEKKTGRRIC